MYIEFVIADNFLLTYLAGTAATKFCGGRVNVWRALGAAAVGTVVAVFYPFMRLGLYGELAVKLALWVVLSAVMYAKTPRALAQSLAFLGCTFMFGGASYALGLLLYANAEKAAEFSVKCPLFLVLGTAGVVYSGVVFVTKRVRAPRARAPYEYKTVVRVFGAELKFNAFLDTGNCVFDDKTGLPVIITDVETFTRKLKGGAAVGFIKAFPRLRSITAATHAGTTKIYIVEPSAVSVYSDRRGHTINAMVGLVPRGRSKPFATTRELLLNPAAMPYRGFDKVISFGGCSHDIDAHNASY